MQYPGGYSWFGQSVSSLFQPVTLDGAPNPARPTAVLAVLAFCVGIGWVFHAISGGAGTRLLRKTIQVAGVGSMVYAFLVVTPMHDLMVGVALGFFVVAVLAVFYMLGRQGRTLLLLTGLLCISGTLWNAGLYYLTPGPGFLPVVQKASTMAWVGWVLVVYYVQPQPSLKSP